MGRGNWFPGNSLEDCEVVYVEYADLGGEHDELDIEFAYQDFKENLLSCLPKSFDIATDSDRRKHAKAYCHRDDFLLAINGMFCVWLDCQGDFWHMGVGLTVREDAPAFAKAKLRDTSRKIFDKLAEMYELRVRSCAWTSALYIPLRQAVAS